jgi:citrate lyase subunit beta/citryl-CoA lyase
MLAKAPTLGVDEAVVDLEDGVTAEDKEAARERAVAAIRRGPLAATTAIRVNGRRTEWWEDDLRAAAEARPDVVVLPKVESPEDVSAAAELLPAWIGLEVLIETAPAFAAAEEIAGADPRVEALLLGPGDLASALGIPVLTIGAGVPDSVLDRIVAAARTRGLQAIDGPHAGLDDDLGLVLSARRALEHGYDGKWVIHPSQIEPVHLVFTPSPAELERAERILASTGALRLEGELVDEASRRLAQSLLARARK